MKRPEVKNYTITEGEWFGLDGKIEDCDGLRVVPFDQVQALEQYADYLEKRVEGMKEALTPSSKTKAYHIAEYKFPIELYDNENGEEYVHEVHVPWSTVKEIMKAILTSTEKPKEEPNP